MSPKMRNVKEYLLALEKTKCERSDQVREGLEIYIDLWRSAINRGRIAEADSVDDALVKLEKLGGLQKAAEA